MCDTQGPKWFLPPNQIGSGAGAPSSPVTYQSNPQATANAGSPGGAAASATPGAPAAPTTPTQPTAPVTASPVSSTPSLFQQLFGGNGNGAIPGGLFGGVTWPNISL